jgi:penicillin-binding protein 1A
MSRVHAGDGALVAEFATQHRVYVPSEDLPDLLVQAFISAEDKDLLRTTRASTCGACSAVRC